MAVKALPQVIGVSFSPVKAARKGTIKTCKGPHASILLQRRNVLPAFQHKHASTIFPDPIHTETSTFP
jgi:hypothetical protein